MDKSKPQIAGEKMSGGKMNCAQAVFSTFSGELGVRENQALSIAQGFGAGMYVDGVCGAVTGAYMTLGLANPVPVENPRQNYDKTRALINGFSRRFKEIHSSIKCTELVGYDLSRPEELAKARESGIFSTKCPTFVRDAAKIVEELLKK